MRKIIICLLTVLTLSATSAYAGSGHSHAAPAAPVTEDQAIQNASGVVDAIVQKGKLEASWADVKPTEAKKKMNKFGEEWVVSFNNPKITDQEKNALYVFLSLDGQYLGASYSEN